MAKMISRETMTVGIVAVVAGLVAAYGIRAYLTPEEETPPPAEKPPAPLKILLAGTDLPADRVVNSHDIMKVPMSKERFKRRFKGLNPEEVIMNPDGIVNRRLKQPVKRGQPFLTTDFYLEGTGPSIAKLLLPGYRAIPVEVSDTRGANVQPGMFVDVMFRANARPAKAGQLAIPEMTLTLLRHIQVLEGERSGKGAGTKGKPLLFTLAVPEAKADMFGVIAGRGEVWLVPTPARNDGTADGAGVEVDNAETLAEVLGLKPPRRPAPPFETVIYRRGHRTINRFVDDKLVSSREDEQRMRGIQEPPGPGELPSVLQKRVPAEEE